MSAAEVPSSHGSLDDDGAPAGTGANPGGGGGPEDPPSDGFDSDGFRQWLRERAQRRERTRAGRDRDWRRRREERHSDDDGRPVGEENGTVSSQPFNWLIKARLWIATIRPAQRPKAY